MTKKYTVKNNNTILAKKAHNKLDYYRAYETFSVK
jgi:hypothetical protein